MDVKKYPLTMHYGNEPVGAVELLQADLPDKLHEYLILPEYRIEDGKATILSYSFVHRSQAASVETTERREKDMGLRP